MQCATAARLEVQGSRLPVVQFKVEVTGSWWFVVVARHRVSYFSADQSTRWQPIRRMLCPVSSARNQLHIAQNEENACNASAVALDKARHGGGTGRPEAANRLQSSLRVTVRVTHTNNLYDSTSRKCSTLVRIDAYNHRRRRAPFYGARVAASRLPVTRFVFGEGGFYLPDVRTQGRLTCDVIMLFI